MAVQVPLLGAYKMRVLRATFANCGIRGTKLPEPLVMKTNTGGAVRRTEKDRSRPCGIGRPADLGVASINVLATGCQDVEEDALLAGSAVLTSFE